jgi:hypothetical protein
MSSKLEVPKQNKRRMSLAVIIEKNNSSDSFSGDELSPDTKQKKIKENFKKVKIQKKLKMTKQIRQKLKLIQYPHLNLVFKASHDLPNGKTTCFTKRNNRNPDIRNSLDSMESDLSERTEGNMEPIDIGMAKMS